MTAELPEPHHDREDVAVVPEQGAALHVLQDQIAALLVVGVVDGPLVWVELQLLKGHRLGGQGHKGTSVDLESKFN